MERLGLDSITQASRSYRAETGHDTERNKPPSRTVTTPIDYRQGKMVSVLREKWRVYYTLTRAGAGITSPL